MREQLVRTLDKCHSIVIGPGLGRDPVTLGFLRNLLDEVVPALRVPVVLDADGIMLVADSWIDKMNAPVVLTPNL